MCKIWIILLFCIAAHVLTCEGSAWLQDPPSRSAAWYYQVKTPVNYNFRNLDCGGVEVKVESNGTRNCGLCGDPYTDRTPRANEVGGKYANPRVRTRYYESGQVAEVSLWNNLPGSPGFYEFRLCDESSNQTQACLDKYLLTIRDTGKTYMTVPRTQGLILVHVELPAGVTCEYCLLQWRFRKESFSGCDDQKWCRVGGAAIEYYNCADVMIGAVGQPKPSYIQDPIYSASDYGSAYDVATTRTDGPDGSNLVGSTTTQGTTTTTDGVPIITIPVTTGTTTDNPATSSGTTDNPVTTNGPIIITVTTPGTTQAPQTTPKDSRLVVDSNGNAVSQTTFGGGSNSNVDNKYLLVLLSLLPLFGAFGMQNSRTTGPVPPFPVPPNAPVTWARTLPIYPIQFGDTYGFGNFRAGTPAYAASGTYGNNKGKGTYASKSSYHAGYSIFNTAQNNFGLGGGNIKSLGANTGVVNRLPINLQNTNIYRNNNINKQWNQAIHFNENSVNKNTGFLNNGVNFNNGGGQLVRNPVVWNNNGVTVNNGFTSHVYPRSINFQNGTPYKPSPSHYSKSSGTMIQSPPPSNEYNSNNHQSGYAPHNNIVPPNPGMQFRTDVKWSTNQIQRVNGWKNGGLGQGTRNLQNNVVNTANNNWQNNGGFGSRNSININRAGTGQRLIAPETATQRMRIITPAVTQSDNSFNLPGIESASRFQVNGPRQIVEKSRPMQNIFSRVRKPNGATIQNRGGKLNGVFTRETNSQNIVGNNNDSGAINNGGSFLVNEWYNMLLKRYQGEATRPL